MSETKCALQDRLSLKPCFKSYISLFESRCLAKLEAMMCSIILHTIHVREIGL